MFKFVLYILVVVGLSGALAWHAWEIASSVSMQVLNVNSYLK